MATYPGYVWDGSAWQPIGSQVADMSPYALVSATAAKPSFFWDSQSPGSLIGTSYGTWASTTVPSTGTATIFSVTFNYQNGNSGATRRVYFRVQIGGVTYGYEQAVDVPNGSPFIMSSTISGMIGNSGTINAQMYCTTASACSVNNVAITGIRI